MVREGMMLAERYEIISKIGAGGMSDVYKAKDYKLNRFVAVKVLKSEFSENKSFVSKFRQEAQSAAALMHPNIVNVYDVGDEYGLHYIVMELVEGITLKHYIEKKLRLSVKEAISIAIQVSMGLEAAHDNHVIHRDVKPQNIIISKEGKVKVTDFGIARAATSDTITSNVMGSVHYTSPEQARGGYSDEKSDIYSLGIVLFEMLTGRVPFDGDTPVSIAIKQIQEPMPNPRDYVDDIPVSVEHIIYKCTEKNSDRRYSSMRELIADLKQSLLTPDENFVKLIPMGGLNGATKLIEDDDVHAIKHNTENIDINEDVLKAYSSSNRSKRHHFDEYEDEQEWEDEDVRVAKVRHRIDREEEDERPIRKRTSSASERSSRSVSDRSRDREADEDIRDRRRSSRDREEERARSRRNAAAARRSSRDRYEEDDDDDEDDIDPQMQKLMTILAVVVAVIIVVIIVTLGKKLLKRSSSSGTDVSESTVTSSESGSVEIESVVGLTFTEAKKKLTDQGFTVQSTTIASDADSKDKVIAVADAEGNAITDGASVAPGSTVVLQVGSGQSGASEKEVPNVTGSTKAEAKVKLDNAGFVMEASEAASKDVPKGKVISQTPEGGTTAESGSTVQIVVSTGPDSSVADEEPEKTEEEKKEEEKKEEEKPEEVKRTVPGIVGMTETAAKTALTASGLSFESVTEQYSDTVTQGLVISQSPQAGASVADGSAVSFVISLGPEKHTYGGSFSIAAPPGYISGSSAELVVTTTGGSVLASTNVTSFPATISVAGVAVDSGTLTVTYKKEVEVEYEDDDGDIVSKKSQETAAVYQSLTFTKE